MPIDYKRYPPNWKKEIVPRILARANNCCESCGLQNGQKVFSAKKGTKRQWFWMLEWATYSENHKEAFRLGLMDKKGEKNNTSKLTESQVLEIRSKKGIKSRTELGSEYGVHYRTISDILTGKSWTHI